MIQLIIEDARQEQMEEDLELQEIQAEAVDLIMVPEVKVLNAGVMLMDIGNNTIDFFCR